MRQPSDRRRQHVTLFTFLVTILPIVPITSAVAQENSPLADVAVPHPERRTVADPSDNAVVSINPPPLLWPVASGKEVRYDVRLSPTEDFSDPATVQAGKLLGAIFNPHKPLAPGHWYWQYRTTRKSSADSKWSAVQRFTIDATAQLCVTPPAQELIAAIPHQHPRILVRTEQLGALRRLAQGTERLADCTRSADRLVKRAVEGVDAARPSQQGKDAFEAKNFAKWASKGYAAKLLAEVKALTFAFLLTGDSRYSKAAVTRGVTIARFDPNGATSRKVSDFADGSCMEAMALVYDSCYDQLDAAERELMRHAMLVRTAPWFAGQMNNLESRVFNAHVWQHIMQAVPPALRLASPRNGHYL